jgi:hypothetical protein
MYALGWKLSTAVSNTRGFDGRRGLAGKCRKVQESAKRIGLRHVEVVAGEHSKPSSASENVRQMLIERGHAPFEHEGDGDVHPRRRRQMGEQVWEKRVVPALHERSPVRRTEDGDGRTPRVEGGRTTYGAVSASRTRLS